jgi:hypothetical protein
MESRLAPAKHAANESLVRLAGLERLQPNSVPCRGHSDHSVVRNLFSFGHLLARDGERKGDAQGDLCLSCTRHLTAPQIAIEAL